MVILNFSNKSFDEVLNYLQEFCDKNLYIITFYKEKGKSYNHYHEYFIYKNFDELTKKFIEENIE